jgi:flagellar biosynthesis protein FlhB
MTPSAPPTRKKPDARNDGEFAASRDAVSAAFAGFYCFSTIALESLDISSAL